MLLEKLLKHVATASKRNRVLWNWIAKIFSKFQKSVDFKKLIKVR